MLGFTRTKKLDLGRYLFYCHNMKTKVSKDPNKNWKNNELQFARLIAELEFAGVWLNRDILDKLVESMDLEETQIIEIVDRACLIWDKIKADTLK